MTEDQIQPTWKVPIFDEDRGQVIRVFRPAEVRSLVANVDVADDKTWGWLKKNNVRTVDVQMWLQAALVTGMRFSELVLLHSRPDFFEKDGNISLPFYRGGKKKRSIIARVVYMSDAGKKVIPAFLKARPLPASTGADLQQSTVALTTIMHAAGKKIGLESRTFLKIINKRKIDENGLIVQGSDGKVATTETEKQYTTNGCAFRSMRKTWVSWLFVAYQNDPQLFSKIFYSMGHLKATSESHYLNYRFDAEDLLEIRKLVQGFGIAQI